MNDHKGPIVFNCLAPELRLQIFQALPSLHSAIALRLTCSELNALYLRYESSIRAALRDRVVREIGSYYDFLTTLHIPRAALKYPPPGGWPHMTPQSCAGAALAKTDFAVDVLRRLPYVAQTAEPFENLHNIELRCYVLDYSTKTPAAIQAINGKISSWLSELRSRHVVLIAKNYGNDGLDIALDTMRAEVNVQTVPYRDRFVMDVEEWSGTMAERCRNLEMMFVPGYDAIVDISWKPEDGDENECPESLGSLMAQVEVYPTRRDAKWIRYLYRKAGWPGPNFLKERALRAVRLFVESRIS